MFIAKNVGFWIFSHSRFDHFLDFCILDYFILDYLVFWILDLFVLDFYVVPLSLSILKVPFSGDVSAALFPRLLQCHP